jgi:uncharacterized repeat protein (TIGR03803 family)
MLRSNMIKNTSNLYMSWCVFISAAVLVIPLEAQTTEVVLHNFGYPLQGANATAGVIRDSVGNLYGTTTKGGLAKAGVVYKVDTAGHQSVLYSFTGSADGGTPSSGVIRDSAGSFYGTTSSGGSAGLGTVYKLDTSGHETVLHSFTGGADGATPLGGVIRDSAGNLYGTTINGGPSNAGVVYRISTTGQETILYNFQGGADGAGPTCGVIRDAAGNLYGTTSGGGSGYGTVYKLDTTGHETLLHSFAAGQDGVTPQAGVTRDSTGNLYGTTTGGGLGYRGVVYKVAPTGGESVLYSFTGGSDGGIPYAGVVRDSAGNLYGAATIGGPSYGGVVYKLDPTGRQTVLYGFGLGAGGYSPESAPVLDSAGNLYGTTEFGGSANNGVVYEMDNAGHQTVLYSFSGDSGGADPTSGVIRDSAGNLYGTAGNGGPANVGVVYKLDSKGHQTVLHAFTGGVDGVQPYAGIILDSAANLYGTTIYGGPANAGVVYKVDSAGQETLLYSFTGGADGANPYAGVIRDSAGNLYGTTYSGGVSNAGVVFKVDPTGRQTVLYSFAGGTDGAHPQAGLIQDAAGTLYGTTQTGGQAGLGVVYKLDPAGNETVLHNFATADGAFPTAGVIRDSVGNLYGTASAGGASGVGVIYMLTPNGQLTVLYSFEGGLDGDNPSSGVIRDSAGNLYGTTVRGSAAGAVYKLNTSGHLTVLHSFTGGADGGAPIGSVTRDSAGNLYGTASYGGQNSSGVIFKLK